MANSNLPRIRTQSNGQSRAPLSRLSSVSSATLFFGPAIPQHDTGNALTNSVSGDGHASFWSAGHDSDEEADLFFGNNGPADSSFSFGLTGDTPSLKKKQRTEPVELLPKKFRPRDSGIVLDESDGGELFGDDGVPRASTSVSTMGSNSYSEALVTPGFGPGEHSGWPTVVDLDDDHDNFGVELRHDGLSADGSIDEFIMRYLTGAAKSSTKGHGESKRVPGTPVKKIRTAQIVDRPWQSAVAHKIGFPEFNGPDGAPKGKSKPTKRAQACRPADRPHGPQGRRRRR